MRVPFRRSSELADVDRNFAEVERALSTPTWVDFPFATGWASFAGGFTGGQFSIDSAGWVSLRGLVVKSAGTGTIGLLPEGFRPSGREVFDTDGDVAYARVDVRSDGFVTLEFGTAATYLTFAGIRFNVA